MPSKIPLSLETNPAYMKWKFIIKHFQGQAITQSGFLFLSNVYFFSNICNTTYITKICNTVPGLLTLLELHALLTTPIAN